MTGKPSARVHKVLIVDDHPIMRRGFVELVSQESDLVVCGEAEDAEGAYQAIDRQTPDIAIVDISLRDSDGIDVIKSIKSRWPDMRVLVLSMHENAIYAEHALRAGAMGYITKQEAPAAVVEGIRRVLGGGIYVSDKIAGRMLAGFSGARTKAKSFAIDRLSERELEVFRLIGQGVQVRDIAARLDISAKTVAAHRENIKSKLNLASAADVLKYAIQWIQFGDR